MRVEAQDIRSARRERRGTEKAWESVAEKHEKAREEEQMKTEVVILVVFMSVQALYQLQ